jgi:DNA-binding transcriptional regulator PaaX
MGDQFDFSLQAWNLSYVTDYGAAKENNLQRFRNILDLTVIIIISSNNIIRNVMLSSHLCRNVIKINPILKICMEEF